MTINRYVLAALGATFLVGATASASFAAPGGPDRGPGRGPERAMMQDMMFVRLLKNADANKDGKISKDEVAAWEETTFAAIDANKDGILTPGELRTYREARMEEWRDKRQAERAENGKGPKGPDMAAGDAPPPPPPGADVRPGDGPGPREMADGDRGPGRHHGDRHWGDRHGMGMGMGPGMGPHGMMPGVAMVRMIDTDENGQISKAEATAAVDKMFARMDRNKDGFITVDDLPDAPF